MRKQLLLGLLLGVTLILSISAYAESKPFITRWKGEKDKELKIPIVGNGYKLVIKKASDNTELKTENSLTITADDNFYIYTPTENGDLLVEAGPEGVEYIRFVDDKTKRGSAENLLTIEQFGTVAWKSMERAFLGCRNMQFATNVDTPDLSKVTNMYLMFQNCAVFNQPLNSWTVSSVTDMGWMFSGCRSFNQPLNNWDVSNVTNMEFMFNDCVVFNQPLNNWNVSNVTKMNSMFYRSRAFNQNLSSWNLKKCERLGLQNCGMDVENYSKSLKGWAAQADINEWLFVEASKLNFNTSAKSARTNLTKEKHWIIQGDVSEGGKTYDLKIWGVQLTSDNIASFQEALTDALVLKKGKIEATVEEDKPILKLDNVALTTPNDKFSAALFYSSTTRVTTQLRGVNSMTPLMNNEIVFSTEGLIGGNKVEDKLLVKGVAIFSGEVRNCTLEIENTFSAGYPSFGLIVDNAIVKAKLIQHFKQLELRNCSILQPEGARFDAAVKAVVDKDGNIAENVVIGSHAASVTLPTTRTLALATKTPLEAKILPENTVNKEVEWFSDKPTIAEVDQKGLVTAKAIGEALITVKTKDGGFTATCAVTVTRKEVPSIKFAAAEVSVTEGKQLSLELRKTGLEATEMVTLTTSAEGTVKVVDNVAMKIEGVAVGEATITAIVAANANHGELKTTCKVKVTPKGTPPPPAAVEDAVLANIVVAPNPFRNELTIKNEELGGQYVLLNTSGVILRSGVLGNGETLIATADLASGLYLLRLTDESGITKTLTVVKE